MNLNKTAVEKAAKSGQTKDSKKDTYEFTQEQKELRDIYYALTNGVNFLYTKMNNTGKMNYRGAYKSDSEHILAKHLLLVEQFEKLRQLEPSEETNYFIDWCHTRHHILFHATLADSSYEVKTSKFGTLDKNDESLAKHTYTRVEVIPKTSSKEGDAFLAQQGVIPRYFVIRDDKEVWYLKDTDGADRQSEWVNSIAHGQTRRVLEYFELISSAKQLIRLSFKMISGSKLLVDPIYDRQQFRNYVARFQKANSLNMTDYYRDTESSIVYMFATDTFQLTTEHSTMEYKFDFGALTGREAIIAMAWFQQWAKECDVHGPQQDPKKFEEEQQEFKDAMTQVVALCKDENKGKGTDSGVGGCVKEIDVSKDQYLRIVLFKDCTCMVVALYSNDSTKPLESVTLSPKVEYQFHKMPSMIKMALDKVA